MICQAGDTPCPGGLFLSMPGPSFAIEIEHEFCAAHAIVIAGTREPVHGHNWRVRVTLAGDRLDADGLLCDFHAAEAELRRIVGPFVNANLNQTPPFDTINPTAERVAEHIATSMQRAMGPGVQVESVRVTEAPGCAAIWQRR
jgi:6-pyruvoyltetrahydropterin/6-carboxytetrahydropterin synthase